jgi:hypothetical protein
MKDRSNDAEIGIAWKLCDNGFPVDEGEAAYILSSGTIDWQGHPPPAEDEGTLRSLIESRIQVNSRVSLLKARQRRQFSK